MGLTRRSFMGLGLLVSMSPWRARAEAEAIDYRALSLRILERIDALRYDFPAVNWPAFDPARIAADGSASFAIAHAVTWQLEHPEQAASHFNANVPQYGSQGFYARLTFYRGAWRGAAAFVPIDFGDLHAWFESGTGDDHYTAVIVAIATILAEESRRVPSAGRVQI